MHGQKTRIQHHLKTANVNEQRLRLYREPNHNSLSSQCLRRSCGIVSGCRVLAAPLLEAQLHQSGVDRKWNAGARMLLEQPIADTNNLSYKLECHRPEDVGIQLSQSALHTFFKISKLMR